MHLRSFVFVLAIVAFSTVAFAQPGAIPAPLNPGVLIDAFQINYLPAYAGTGTGTGAGGYVDITNAGELGAPPFGPGSLVKTGDICANVFVFNADEELAECCTCLVTPNALVHLTASDLTSNTNNGLGITTGVVVKLLATFPSASSTTFVPGTNAGPFTNTICNIQTAATYALTTANLAPGMRAWATKFHTNPTTSTPTVGLTETAFLPANLSQGELTMMQTLCAEQVGNGTGAGVCNNCTLGGLGAGAK
jgi:hypothetical protein